MINQNTYIGASFSLSNRILRSLWNIVYVFLFRFSPKPIHKWRTFLLRCFGAKVGKGVHVYPGVKIWAPWNLEIGDQCGIADGVILYSQGKINIGRKSVISQGVNLCAGTHDYTKPGFPAVTMPINIGEEVWIASEAFIHPGIHIADGCVIGARSVVTSNMPAWMVCGGHPCRPITVRKMEQ